MTTPSAPGSTLATDHGTQFPDHELVRNDVDSVTTFTRRCHRVGAIGRDGRRMETVLTASAATLACPTDRSRSKRHCHRALGVRVTARR
jgi:hypothetical protein